MFFQCIDTKEIYARKEIYSNRLFLGTFARAFLHTYEIARNIRLKFIISTPYEIAAYRAAKCPRGFRKLKLSIARCGAHCSATNARGSRNEIINMRERISLRETPFGLVRLRAQKEANAARSTLRTRTRSRARFSSFFARKVERTPDDLRYVAYILSYGLKVSREIFKSFRTRVLFAHANLNYYRRRENVASGKISAVIYGSIVYGNVVVVVKMTRETAIFLFSEILTLKYLEKIISHNKIIH